LDRIEGALESIMAQLQRINTSAVAPSLSRALAAQAIKWDTAHRRVLTIDDAVKILDRQDAEDLAQSISRFGKVKDTKSTDDGGGSSEFVLC
jgi:hypothetical protein